VQTFGVENAFSGPGTRVGTSKCESRAKAKENLKTSTGGDAPRPLATLPKAETINTRKEIAAASQVKERTLARAKVISAKASAPKATAHKCCSPEGVSWAAL
jgi:hypothetical protein